MNDAPEMNFREQWEEAAESEFQTLSRLPLAELMQRFRKRRFGEYQTLWRALVEKGTLPEIGWELYAFACSGADYLPRHHCAGALLELMQCTDYQAQDLTVASNNDPSLALAEVRRRLEAQIGPPPSTQVTASMRVSRR